MRITEEHINETAMCLNMLGAADNRFHTIASFPRPARRRGIPSVRTVYGRFMALPPDHPLKERYAEGLVQRGYQKLRTHLNFDERCSYSDLGTQMLLYMA